MAHVVQYVCDQYALYLVLVAVHPPMWSAVTGGITCVGWFLESHV